MAVPWGLVVFVIGIAYGYLQPGKQDKSKLFMKGLLWGLVVAVVVALLGWVFNANPLGLGDVGFWGILWAALILSLAFIIGVWIGDLVSRGRDRRAAAPRRLG